MAQAKKELVNRTTGEITNADDLSGYAADAGAGFENQTAEDVSLPFLVVLQPGSPEVQDENAAARPGMIINKTTGDLTKGSDGLTFIPAWTDHLMVEWRPRDAGGGLVASHPIDAPLARKVRAEQQMGKYHTEGGNDLIETFYVYGLALTEDGSPYPAVIAFSSSHIKGYKDWMFRAKSIQIAKPDGTKISRLPLFSHAYRIRTVKREGNGNTWFVPVVSFAGEDATQSRLAPTSELYLAARSVKEGVSQGLTRAATESLTADAKSTKADAAAAPY